MRVWEALDLFAAFSSRDVDWRSLMAAWSLDSLAGRSYGNLSGGQRHKRQLVRPLRLWLSK
jgi:ABC-type hemin transport system ATPase subunit